MKKACFMGQMAASLSHDLCNVLATIQQAAGLLDDYLGLARKESLKSLGIRPQFKYTDKFGSIIGQIRSHVGRGQDMCELLSRLAHAPDDNQGSAELAGAAQLLAALSERLVKRHKATLEVTPTLSQLRVDTPLIEALVLMHRCLALVLERGSGSGPVRLATAQAADGAPCVDVTREGISADEAQALKNKLDPDLLGPVGALAIEGGLRLVFNAADGS